MQTFKELTFYITRIIYELFILRILMVARHLDTMHI